MTAAQNASDVLLQVESSTTPTPLAVSAASKARLASMDLRFTKPPQQLEFKCRRITIRIPLGTAHDDLTSDRDGCRFTQIHGDGVCSAPEHERAVGVQRLVVVERKVTPDAQQATVK